MNQRTNHPTREELLGDHITEYRVTGMNGQLRDSGIYSIERLGPDALAKAKAAQSAFGGTIQTRTISFWTDLASGPPARNDGQAHCGHVWGDFRCSLPAGHEDHDLAWNGDEDTE